MTGATVGFLGQRLTLETGGESLSEDALWLAAWVPPLAKGSRVLEVGCGVGPCILALALRMPDNVFTGLEIDPTLAELARCNAQRNEMTLQVICGDILAVTSPALYHAVVCNPPFYIRETHFPTRKISVRRAKELGQEKIFRWLDALVAHIAPEGWLCLMVHVQWENILKLWQSMRGGSLEICPLQTSPQRPPKRLLVRWRASGKAVVERLPVAGYDMTLRAAVLRRGEALTRE